MNLVIVGLSAAVLLLLLFIFFQQLKGQIAEMKTRQLESQAEALARQVELFNQTQAILSDQLAAIMKSVTENLSRTQGNLTAQLGQTGVVISDIQKKLGTLEEATRQVKEIGSDISKLQDILQAPKLRGSLGEYLLEDLLSQIFPQKNFQMKYGFKNGTQVDAVIRLGQGLVPVDAKFPLESFQRLVAAKTEEEKKAAKKEFIASVKRRIDEIAEKYIRPEEGTFDFALIYIPAENVFYETVISDQVAGRDYEIFNYAVQRRVIPVSPNSFYAYLTAIVFGLKGFRIEQQAKTIMAHLSTIQDQFGRFLVDLNMVGRHIANAQGKFEECLKRGEKFGDQIGRLAGLQPDSEKSLKSPD